MVGRTYGSYDTDIMPEVEFDESIDVARGGAAAAAAATAPSLNVACGMLLLTAMMNQWLVILMTMMRLGIRTRRNRRSQGVDSVIAATISRTIRWLQSLAVTKRPISTVMWWERLVLPNRSLLIVWSISKQLATG